MPENRKRNVTLTIRVTPGEKDAILPLYSPFSFSAGFVIPVPTTVDIHPDGAGEIADEGFLFVYRGNTL